MKRFGKAPWIFLAVLSAAGAAVTLSPKKPAGTASDPCCAAHGGDAEGAASSDRPMHPADKTDFSLPPGHPAVDLSKPVKAPPLTQEQMLSGGVQCPHLKGDSDFGKNHPDKKLN